MSQSKVHQRTRKRDRNPTIAGESQGEEGFDLTKRPPKRASSPLAKRKRAPKQQGLPEREREWLRPLRHQKGGQGGRGAAKQTRTALSQIRATAMAASKERGDFG